MNRAAQPEEASPAVDHGESRGRRGAFQRIALGKLQAYLGAMLDDLTVAEAAEALGASRQTVRTLLRTGELKGRREPWGRRYVWVPSRKGVDNSFPERTSRWTPPPTYSHRSDARRDGHGRIALSLLEAPPVGSADGVTQPPHDPYAAAWDDAGARPHPFFLRARGRATLFLVVVGLPLVLVYVAAYFFTDALWFDEIGQLSVFGRTVAAKTELYVLAGGVAAFVIGANLTAAVSRTRITWTRGTKAAVAAVSLVTGSYFASAASGHWQAFVLWQHRQSFGVKDPLHGKDVGFFVFTLPFERVVVQYLFLVVAAAAAAAAFVYWGRGSVGIRPLRVSREAQVHAAVLGAAFLLILAWRLRLEQYSLELGQPSPKDGSSFAGANYVDARVRTPGFAALSIFAVVLAFVCVAAPSAARNWFGRRPTFILGALVALFGIGLVVVSAWLPALVQRYAVDPNPLLSERPYLTASIAATRRAGARRDRGRAILDHRHFGPADIPGIRKRLAMSLSGTLRCSRRGCASSLPRRPTTSRRSQPTTSSRSTDICS